MKHFLTLIFTVIAVTYIAQTESSLLWKISGKGIKKTSYLYGTFHIADERVHFMMDTINDLLERCKYMAGELNHEEEMADPMKLMGAMKMEGTSLKDLYTEEEYEYVSERLKEELGPMVVMISDMKPFYIYAIVSSDFEDMMEQEQSGIGGILDDEIQVAAREKGLKIFGLETAEEAISVIDEISLEEQAQILMLQLESMEEEDISADKMMEEMIEVYMRQDLEGMMSLYQEDSLGDQFEAKLIVYRNNYFTERLINLMKEKPTFCAVGALHLPGDQGMIKMLRDEGYTVEPVYFKKED